VKNTQAIFFDVGGTLGRVDAQLKLHLFSSTKSLLKTCGETLGLRIGTISNLPAGMTSAQFKNILEQAGIAPVFDPALIVSSADAGVAKPNAAIYAFAAARAGVPAGQCLYVGEDPAEVDGAIAAGMAGILKPPG
jgi:FMN phosphatase YigB (HAD superfamily)